MYIAVAERRHLTPTKLSLSALHVKAQQGAPHASSPVHIDALFLIARQSLPLIALNYFLGMTKMTGQVLAVGRVILTQLVHYEIL